MAGSDRSVPRDVALQTTHECKTGQQISGLCEGGPCMTHATCSSRFYAMKVGIFQEVKSECMVLRVNSQEGVGFGHVSVHRSGVKL